MHTDLMRLLQVKETALLHKLRTAQGNDVVMVQAELKAYETIRGWFRPTPVGAQFRAV